MAETDRHFNRMWPSIATWKSPLKEPSTHIETLVVAPVRPYLADPALPINPQNALFTRGLSGAPGVQGAQLAVSETESPFCTVTS